MKLIKALASLRLTVVCLALGLVLVFGGTIAQVHLGLYEVQARYFRSLLVYWTPEGSHLRIPIFPGGWLIGGVLVINLIAGHLTRFKLTRSKIGLWLAHLGLIFLLVGQFFTEAFQVESLMRIEVGETRAYSEDSRKIELAVIDTTDPDGDKVISIPESTISTQTEIRDPQLPFTLRVKNYLPNANPTMPNPAQPQTVNSANGIGKHIAFSKAPTTATMEGENRPAVRIEVVGDKGPIGDWMVSTWLSRVPYINNIKEAFGSGADAVFAEPQGFTYNGRTYQLSLRNVRYYKPYTLTLKEFRHDVYPGTTRPKNFSSRVQLVDPSSGENREVLIYMNNPLRYKGDTYYQSSFEPGDRVSILQVVRNPAASTPYVSCIMITLGLLIQFIMHLVRFGQRQENAPLQPVKTDSTAKEIK